MSGPIFKPAGFLKLATIKRVDPDLMIAYISFRDSISGTDESSLHPAQLPVSYLSSGGGFIGGYPAEGTPVLASQAEGSSRYFIVSFLARDPATRINSSPSQIKIPKLIKGEVVIQADTNSSINLNNQGITIGDPRNSVTFDTKRKLILNSFDYSYYIGQGTREINGVIKRDRRPNKIYPNSLMSSDTSYDDNLKIIGMDPVADTSNSNIGRSIRNPARIEKRELVYEYEEFAKVQSNDIELEFYKNGNFPNNAAIVNRREGRADTLSLSLVAPNYLLETIKGTVVDLFGNILDINRNIIPIGKFDNLSIVKLKSATDQISSNKNIYEEIKKQERKSLAYHFEINARKETIGSGPPSVNNKDDYARSRSRFFLDIDKEGQFKLNVPASSETGNIPLLTRYENYSTVSPDDSTKNPNSLVFNEDYKDVLLESFSNNQIIEIKDDLQNINSPIDRFTNTNIKHGTAYHDISKTINTLQAATFYSPVEYTSTTGLSAGRVLGKSDIISKQIITSGKNANAGGRSGSLNFDGSLEINIGANSVDRQSLWLDTQGGIIANVGRDLRNNISLAANMDGEVVLQIGGSTVPAEKGRFKNSSTGWIAGVLDIRVFNTNNTNGHNELTIFRIDNEGITMTTPGRMVFYSAQKMLFRSSASIEFDAETVIINSREVTKDPGKGPIR